jgi:hypothetical protein
LAIFCKDHRKTGDSAEKEVSSDNKKDAKKKAEDSKDSDSV